MIDKRVLWKTCMSSTEMDVGPATCAYIYAYIVFVSIT